MTTTIKKPPSPPTETEAEAAEHRAALRAGRRAVREWECEHGALTAGELAEADEALDRAGVDRSASLA